MTPSPATARRTFQGARRRRRRNDAAASPLSLRGGSGADASARALAAGLWRLRHAQRIKAAGAGDGPASASQKQAHKLKARNSHLCHGHRRRADHLAAAGTGSHCRHRGILDTIDACVEWPVACCTSSMEKATKWDRVDDDTFLASHSHHRHHRHQSTAAAAAASSSSPSPLLVLMEAELEKARGQVGELEEERRVMAKRLERFLRKLAEEKAAWKARVRGKARRAVAALSEELGAERRHRRQLEQANAKLMRELAEARSSAEQQAQSYEAERKARELMEEACSELTREVEEDQAEVELLRRECLRMREDMEEERRMLQMAEVWREERVQMKLSDAKLALESKYTQLNRLQAEMEAFLGSKRAGEPPPAAMPRSYDDHFRRSPAPASSSRSRSDGELQSVSPATDLFLANIDDDDDMYGNLGEMEYDGARDSSCSWVGTSDRSAEASVANNGNTEARSSWASRRSLGKNNTALIRRLWRSAITESRNKTGAGRANGGGGWSPASDRRSSVTAEALAPPPLPAPVPAAVVAGGSSSLPQRHGHGHGRQSLKEKLMAARMDGQKTLHAVKQKP